MILYRKVWNLLSSVWNLSMVLYGTMNICMETMGVWKSSFGLESLDTWVGTLLFCVWFGFGNSQTHFLLGLS